MKIFPKLSLFLLSVLFVVGGVFVKLQTGKETESLKGTVAGRQTNIISGRYPEIPIYGGAAVTSILEKTDSVFLTLESTDDVTLIKKYYEKELEKIGWKKWTDGFVLENKKLSLVVTTSQDQSQTIILLSYTFVPTK